MLICSLGIVSGRGGGATVRATFFAGRFFGRERFGLAFFALTAFFLFFAVVAFFFLFLMASPRRGRRIAPSTGRSNVAECLGSLGSGSWRPIYPQQRGRLQARSSVGVL
jgi:hypothetical protein